MKGLYVWKKILMIISLLGNLLAQLFGERKKLKSGQEENNGLSSDLPLQDVEPSSPSLPSSSEYQESYKFSLQTDSAFPESYNRFGCYVHSIAKIAYEYESWSGRPSELNAIVEEAVKVGVVTENMKVMYPDRLFEMFGLNVTFTQKHEEPDRICKDGEVEVLFFTAGTLQHFVVGDGKGNVKWDPYGDSKTVREGSLKSKRIFKVNGVI